MNWETSGPDLALAFPASVMEPVQAFAIALAVASVRSWRWAVCGSVVASILLISFAFAIGPILEVTSPGFLDLIFGTVLLLFGLRRLRNAILRIGGASRSREEIVLPTAADLPLGKKRCGAEGARSRNAAPDKPALHEGLELVFAIIFVCAGGRLLNSGDLLKYATCLLALPLGIILNRLLSPMNQDAPKFGAAVMLSALGMYWTGKGLGVQWPWQDLDILVFAAAFLLIGISLVEDLLEARGEDEIVNIVNLVWRELFHFFLDDKGFVLVIGAVIAGAAGLGLLFPDNPIVVGVTLFLGCAMALIETVMSAKRRGYR